LGLNWGIGFLSNKKRDLLINPFLYNLNSIN